MPGAEKFFIVKFSHLAQVEKSVIIKEKQKMEFDFGAVDYDAFNINVNIGAATYWSSLMQVQTDIY